MMRMPSVTAYPVQVLREHATALEAALSVCLAEPEKRAVHKLRTDTRRLEAQIALLKLMKGLPPFRAAAARLLKQSKKLRRAAAEVRDLDVQHKLIEDEAAALLRTADDRLTLQKRFNELLASRDHVREESAKKLTAVLHKSQGKVAGSLEALMETLKPAARRPLGPTEMVRLVGSAFRATRELRFKAPDENDLHTIRKAAKRARYQLETAPDSAVARRAAKGYETLQDAGGLWHDWHDLAQLAVREFGEHHRITAAFVAEREKNLATYRRLLEKTREQLQGKARPAATRKAGVARKVAPAKQVAGKSIAS